MSKIQQPTKIAFLMGLIWIAFIAFLFLLLSCTKQSDDHAPIIHLAPMDTLFHLGDTLVVDARATEFCEKYPTGYLLVTNAYNIHDSIRANDLVAKYFFLEIGNYEFNIIVREHGRGHGSFRVKHKCVVK